MGQRYWESAVANVVEHGIGPSRVSRADVDFDEIAVIYHDFCSPPIFSSKDRHNI